MTTQLIALSGSSTLWTTKVFQFRPLRSPLRLRIVLHHYRIVRGNTVSMRKISAYHAWSTIAASERHIVLTCLECPVSVTHHQSPQHQSMPRLLPYADTLRGLCWGVERVNGSTESRIIIDCKALMSKNYPRNIPQKFSSPIFLSYYLSFLVGQAIQEEP